jgi:hypothetical protein
MHSVRDFLEPRLPFMIAVVLLRLSELNLNVSTEELLAERAFTYADLYAVLEVNMRFLWLTPQAYSSGGRACHLGTS